jgi:hypothetical protein
VNGSEFLDFSEAQISQRVPSSGRSRAVLTVTLPKTAEAQKATKKIEARQADGVVGYFDDPGLCP